MKGNDQMREALADLRTHQNAWRIAISRMLALAQTNNSGVPDDDADQSFWEHQLRAYDRTFAALRTSESVTAGEGEVVHWISANADGSGNVTACGKAHVYPMRGNGWRVRDITCPDCDKALCHRLAYTPATTTADDAVADLDMQALASVIHDARYDQGRAHPGWVSYDEEYGNGQTYCLRIANAVANHLAAIRTPPATDKGEGATSLDASVRSLQPPE